jgi:hypothetical protein
MAKADLGLALPSSWISLSPRPSVGQLKSRIYCLFLPDPRANLADRTECPGILQIRMERAMAIRSDAASHADPHIQ